MSEKCHDISPFLTLLGDCCASQKISSSQLKFLNNWFDVT